MDHLKLCIKAALAGGKAISDYKPKEAKKKPSTQLAHHSIVTDADFLSQKHIFDVLKKDKEAFFISEERVYDKELKKRMLTLNNIDKIKSSRVYIVDELDGSSSFSTGHYEWSISIGYIENMVYKAGAIFAPKIEVKTTPANDAKRPNTQASKQHGTLFFASAGKGAFVKRNGKDVKLNVANRNLDNCYVIHGPDSVWSKYPVHNKLLTVLGDKIRTTNITNSCALGMALVAAGNVDALVETIISPWDWAAGKLLVEEAGGKVIFYEMDKIGKIKPIEGLEPRHYNMDERQVGFVAANKKLAEQIMKILLNLNEPTPANDA